MAGLEVGLRGLVIGGTSHQVYSRQKVAVLSSRSMAANFSENFSGLPERRRLYTRLLRGSTFVFG